MNDLFSTLSTELAAAADVLSPSVVQVQAGRRLAAGVVFDTDLVMTLLAGRAGGDDGVGVRRADGQTFDGVVLGGAAGTGITVVRVPGLGAPAVKTAEAPRPGHLALAVGRTWSGNLFVSLAPVSVVGGPLRTGRSSEIARVIRVGLAPHGALTGGALGDGAGALLGLITSAAIRGTTVVIPASIALAAARDVVTRGGERQGFLGVSSVPVTLPTRQRMAGHEQGLLVTAVSSGGPAELAGALVGDIIVSFEGVPVREPEELLTRLRGITIGAAATLAVLRGGHLETLSVTVQERRRV